MMDPIKETITGEIADVIDVISDYDNDKTVFYQNWNEKVYGDYESSEDNIL